MEVQSPFQIAIFLYPGVTTLDAVGPFEVLSHMPATEVRYVAKETGPITTEGGILLLGATHTMAETTSPDPVIVPGGTTTPGQTAMTKCWSGSAMFTRRLSGPHLFALVLSSWLLQAF